MKELSPKERVMNALSGREVDRRPVTATACPGGAVTAAMQRETGVFWPAAHKDPEQMVRLARAACEIGGLECIKLPLDDVVEAEALGCATKYPDQIYLQPVTTDSPYSRPADVKIPARWRQLGRIPIVLEAIGLAKREVGDFLPIASHVVGPFTLACELVGFKRFSVWTIKTRGRAKDLLQLAAEFTIEFAKAQYEAGSDVVAVVEGGLAPGLVTPNALEYLIQPVLLRIAERLEGLKFLFVGGSKETILPLLIRSGYDGISVDETVNIARIKASAGDVRLLGNVNSQRTLVAGSPKEVKLEAKQAILGGVDLVEPSCGIPPNTPIGNIRALVEASKECALR